MGNWYESDEKPEMPPKRVRKAEDAVKRGLVVSVPEDEFMPSTDFPVRADGSWKPPRPGNKEPYRYGYMDDGTHVIVYANGAVKRNDGTGKWIASGFKFDEVTAHEGHAARIEKARAAAEAGLIEAYGEIEGINLSDLELSGNIAYRAWAAIVKSRAVMAMQGGGRDATDAARAVGRWTGMTGDEDGGDKRADIVIRMNINAEKALEGLRNLPLLLGDRDE